MMLPTLRLRLHWRAITPPLLCPTATTLRRQAAKLLLKLAGLRFVQRAPVEIHLKRLHRQEWREPAHGLIPRMRVGGQAVDEHRWPILRRRDGATPTTTGRW